MYGRRTPPKVEVLSPSNSTPLQAHIAAMRTQKLQAHVNSTGWDEYIEEFDALMKKVKDLTDQVKIYEVQDKEFVKVVEEKAALTKQLESLQAKMASVEDENIVGKLAYADLYQTQRSERLLFEKMNLELNALRSEHTRKIANHALLKHQLRQLQGQQTLAEDRISGFKNDVTALMGKNQTLHTEINGLKKGNNKLHKQIKDLQNEINQNLNDHADKIKIVNASMEEAQLANANLSNKIVISENAQAEIKRTLMSKDEVINSLQAEKAQLNELLQASKTELDNLKGQYANEKSTLVAKAKFESASQLKALRKEIYSKSQHLYSLQNDYNEKMLQAEKEIKQANSEKMALELKINPLNLTISLEREAHKKQLENERSDFQAKEDVSKVTIKKLEEELKKLKNSIQAEKEHQEQSKKTINSQHAKVKEQCDKYRKELENMQREKKNMKEKLDSLNKVVSEQSMQLHHLKVENAVKPKDSVSSNKSSPSSLKAPEVENFLSKFSETMAKLSNSSAPIPDYSALLSDVTAEMTRLADQTKDVKFQRRS